MFLRQTRGIHHLTFIMSHCNILLQREVAQENKQIGADAGELSDDCRWMMDRGKWRQMILSRRVRNCNSKTDEYCQKQGYLKTLTKYTGLDLIRLYMPPLIHVLSALYMAITFLRLRTKIKLYNINILNCSHLHVTRVSCVMNICMYCCQSKMLFGPSLETL